MRYIIDEATRALQRRLDIHVKNLEIERVEEEGHKKINKATGKTTFSKPENIS